MSRHFLVFKTGFEEITQQIATHGDLQALVAERQAIGYASLFEERSQVDFHFPGYGSRVFRHGADDTPYHEDMGDPPIDCHKLWGELMAYTDEPKQD